MRLSLSLAIALVVTQQDPAIVTHFNTRVRAYVELRNELEKGLPAQTVTGDPAEIRKVRIALATRIRVARAKAKQGDMFTPAVGVEFRKALLREMNADTWKVVMDDNPGDFEPQINGAYPEGKPLSTMPPDILAVLPGLPKDIEYRFVGRHLILLDTRARLILDRIPYAILRQAPMDGLTRTRDDRQTARNVAGGGVRHQPPSLTANDSCGLPWECAPQPRHLTFSKGDATWNGCCGSAWRAPPARARATSSRSGPRSGSGRHSLTVP
jgi:hypothetical protein